MNEKSHIKVNPIGMPELKITQIIVDKDNSTWKTALQ